MRVLDGASQALAVARLEEEEEEEEERERTPEWHDAAGSTAPDRSPARGPEPAPVL